MKLKLLGLGLSSILATSLFANDVPYSYIDVGYASADLGEDGGLSVDGDGFALSGSAEFGGNIYGFGGYTSYGLPGGADLDFTSLGLGYKYGIGSSTDLNFEISYRSLGLDAPGFGESEDNSGYGLGIGIRSMVASNVEFGAKLERLDIENDSETFYGINGAYYFNNNWAVSGDLTFSEFFDTFELAVRYKF